jgi:hypothetical protein
MKHEMVISRVFDECIYQVVSSGIVLKNFFLIFTQHQLLSFIKWKKREYKLLLFGGV